MGASEKVLQALAERDATLELDLDAQVRYNNELPDGSYLYEVEVIFDGALDESFVLVTNKIGQIVSAIAADCAREYTEAEGTLGWSVEARLFEPDEIGYLHLADYAEPVCAERVAPTL